MSNIPNDILCNIVERLPITALVRSKLLSIEWRNFINSSDFINRHLQNSFKDPDSHVLFCFTYYGYYGSSIYLVHDLDTFRTSKLTLPPAFQHDKNMKLVGSCNGLLCVGSGVSMNQYLLFNPVNSGTFKIVPYAKNVFSRDHYTHCSVVSGFGYDEISDDYKIVYLWRKPHHFNSVDEEEFDGMIYSLKLGSWKPVDNRPPKLGMNYLGILNNRLHFDDEEDCNVFISFDLNSEAWDEVHLPNVERYATVKKCIVNKRLSVLLIQVGFDYQEFWVMQNYGVQESWMKLCNFNFERPCRVLYYSARLQQFLLLVDILGLVWFSEQEEQIEGQIKIDQDVSYIDDVEMIIGSLVPIGIRRRIHDHRRQRRGFGLESLKEAESEEVAEVAEFGPPGKKKKGRGRRKRESL